jgi:hypothetical protein
MTSQSAGRSLLLLVGLLMLLPSFAQALTIYPETQTRRFVAAGSAYGSYEDGRYQVGLEGNTAEFTFWHKRGEWGITRGASLGWYGLSGNTSSEDDTAYIDYQRIMLASLSIGYDFDVGFLRFQPQYRVGYGRDSLTRELKGNSPELITQTGAVIMEGTELLIHYDLSSPLFVGLKYGSYINTEQIDYESDRGQLKMNRTVLLTIGLRSSARYSTSKGLSRSVPWKLPSRW